MAGNAEVIDELIVKLSLDAKPYQAIQKTVDAGIAQTAKKLKRADTQARLGERSQQSRLRSLGTAVKGFRASALGLYGTLTALPLAFAGILSGLSNFETGLSRQSVATGLSNRQMQAWGSTARRLGADASSGQQAVADLSKELQNYKQGLGGDNHLLQAFSQIGVNIKPSSDALDLLSQAQERYRSLPAPQQQLMESRLSQQGVSADQILMIKSETNLREAYNQSLKESIEQDKAAASAFNEAMASAKNASLAVANSLSSLLTPAIQTASGAASLWAKDLSDFSNDVQKAGGGLQGFQAALDKDAPDLGDTLRAVTRSVDVFGKAIDVVSYAFNLIKGSAKKGSDWVGSKIANTPVLMTLWDKFGEPLRRAASPKTLSDYWDNAVQSARANGPAPVERSVSEGNKIAARTSRRKIERKELVQALKSQGLSQQTAEALTINAEAESGLDPSAVNRSGGGQGAHGLFQWRGDRLKAFVRRYGVLPELTSVATQAEFAATDPFERGLIVKSMSRGGNPAANLSDIYEGHGNLAESARRGRLYNNYKREQSPADPSPSPSNTSITISGPVSVRANNPQELMGSLQRVSSLNNYQSAVR